MTNEEREKIERAKNRLQQASMELTEAAKIISGQGLPKTASLFEEAARAKNESYLELLTLLMPPLITPETLTEIEARNHRIGPFEMRGPHE